MGPRRILAGLKDLGPVPLAVIGTLLMVAVLITQGIGSAYPGPSDMLLLLLPIMLDHALSRNIPCKGCKESPQAMSTVRDQ